MIPELSDVVIKDGEVVINEDSDDLDFRVESNGDANMFFVDGGNDRIYMGRNVTDGVGNARLQIEAQDGEAGLSIHRGSASTGGGKIFFSKSRAATAGDDTVVQDGDQLGALLFTGADGTDRESAGAEISVEVNGTPGSNDMPGRIMFATTADGAAAVTERMRIPSDGRILFGCTSEPTNSVSGVQLSNAGTFSSCKFSVGNNVGNFTQISFINGNEISFDQGGIPCCGGTKYIYDYILYTNDQKADKNWLTIEDLKIILTKKLTFLQTLQKI